MNAIPKVDSYGVSEAEERFLLDITMIVKKKPYEVKVIFYNTRCSLTAIGKGGNPQKKVKALDDQTVGEYFVKHLVPKVVDFLSSKLDIKQLNELCRKQALLGQTATQSSVCIYCEKYNKDKNVFKCKKCEVIVHVKGYALKYIGQATFDVAKEDPINYCCDKCSYGSIKAKQSKEVMNIQTIETLDILDMSKQSTDLSLEETSMDIDDSNAAKGDSCYR